MAYRTTAPAWEPITLAQLKAQARIDGSEEDDLLETMISATRAWAEGHTGLRFTEVTVTEVRHFFPTCRELELSVEPLQAVAWLKYYDTAGTLQTLSNTWYYVDTYSSPPMIVLGQSYQWPETQEGRPNAVQIEYTVGPESADDVDPRAKQAMLLMATYWEQNRENPTTGKVSAPEITAAERLLNQLKLY